MTSADFSNQKKMSFMQKLTKKIVNPCQIDSIDPNLVFDSNWLVFREVIVDRLNQ